MYKNKPLTFVHTHFHEKRQDIALFNNVIIANLKKIKDYKTLAIISRMVDQCWKIKLPKQPMIPPWNHSNDSFRELLILLMNKNTDLKLELNANSGHIWFNNILLYDRPTDLWFNNEVNTAYKVLLGNGDINVEGKRLNNN